MDKASPAAVDRRVLLTAVGVFASGWALPIGGQAQAETAARRKPLRAYVGAFTTEDRKGHGGGVNVYHVDPASGIWTHEQLLEAVNPSFLAIDRAQRFLYSVHAGLDEVSAYAIDEQTAIQVVDGVVEVVSEGVWTAFDA